LRPIKDVEVIENNPMRRKKRETKEMDCRRKVAIVLESLEVQREGQKSVENGNTQASYYKWRDKFTDVV